jgi:hypothetical protein
VSWDIATGERLGEVTEAEEEEIEGGVETNVKADAVDEATLTT